MALIKNMMTETGVPISYHRIGAIHYYIGKGFAHIDVDSYYNKEMYEMGAPPMVMTQFGFSGDACPFTPETVTVAAAYASVKTIDMFADTQET